MSFELKQKIKTVHKILNKKKVLVAFSGGVDSSVITSLAKEVCEEVLAVTANSNTFPEDEILNAEKVAKELGIKWKIIEIDELANDKFAENPPIRCYYCKKELMNELLNIVQAENFDLIIDGTNASDLHDHRPGILALKELKVKSPLAEAGITKKEIRQIAKDRGISVWQRPSMACLSSRFPYGERITAEKLKMVENAERFIRNSYDIKILRVRYYNGLARIEVGKEEIKRVLSEKRFYEILNYLKNLGFKYVTLDLEGYRTGSMNEIL